MKNKSKNKNILVGVCGGIASYKTCELIRLFVKNGFLVKVMMTESAVKFVTPLVFQNLSKNPVYIEMFAPLEKVYPLRDKSLVKPDSSGGVRTMNIQQGKTLGPEECLKEFQALKEENARHISLARWADICVIAPLSANSLSKIAVGICDNLLTTVICAFSKRTKVVLVLAMNEYMWKNPSIRNNVKKLKKIKNYFVFNPQKGELACGTYGEGRMPEPGDIFKKIKTII